MFEPFFFSRRLYIIKFHTFWFSLFAEVLVSIVEWSGWQCVFRTAQETQTQTGTPKTGLMCFDHTGLHVKTRKPVWLL